MTEEIHRFLVGANKSLLRDFFQWLFHKDWGIKVAIANPLLCLQKIIFILQGPIQMSFYDFLSYANHLLSPNILYLYKHLLPQSFVHPFILEFSYCIIYTFVLFHLSSRGELLEDRNHVLFTFVSSVGNFKIALESHRNNHFH